MTHKRHSSPFNDLVSARIDKISRRQSTLCGSSAEAPTAAMPAVKKGLERWQFHGTTDDENFASPLATRYRILPLSALVRPWDACLSLRQPRFLHPVLKSRYIYRLIMTRISTLRSVSGTLDSRACVSGIARC